MNYFNYFSEIEELFIRRRGRNLLLSPLDWALIEGWQEREVPLHIILRGIEKVFDTADKQPNKKRPIKSLLYCKEEIEAQYTEWLERQVGAGKVQGSNLEVQGSKETSLPSSNLFSDEQLAAHLETICAGINQAGAKAEGDLQATLKIISAHLIELRGQHLMAEKLEESLEKLDALIDENLLRTSDTEKLKIEIEKQIISHKSKMEPDVYRRTFDLMMLKNLREKAQIPRLSLFYL